MPVHARTGSRPTVLSRGSLDRIGYAEAVATAPKCTALPRPQSSSVLYARRFGCYWPSDQSRARGSKPELHGKEIDKNRQQEQNEDQDKHEDDHNRTCVAEPKACSRDQNGGKARRKSNGRSNAGGGGGRHARRAR